MARKEVLRWFGAPMVLLCVNVAQAECVCLDELTPRRAAELADVIVIGEVVEIETVSNFLNWAEARLMNVFSEDTTYYAHRDAARVTVAVHQVFKGPRRDNVKLTTSPLVEWCGVDFEVGETYLVFAAYHRGRLVTQKCMTTKPVKKARADIEQLERHFAAGAR